MPGGGELGATPVPGGGGLGVALAPGGGQRLTVLHADALTLDGAALLPPPRAVVANLPYNIATPLLIGWLRDGAAWASLTLMFQREVAQRITAAPGTRAYGRLSVLAQWCCAEIAPVMDLAPGAFWPAPKVHSRVVRLTPRAPAPGDPPMGAVEAVTRRAFAARRKMLRAGAPELVPALESLGIDPTLRPEALTPAQYAALATSLAVGRK
jgi:16S rRNA (adenine1518-N6/adenine1519-N6)-dimethyltransferase